MARKEKKYHYIYKTTNLKNGKYYVGMHSSDNLEDGYMGSGKRLRLSLNKHGKENFKIEVLEFLPNRNSLKEREKELINEDVLKDSLCMNLKQGGEGGFVDEEHRKNFLMYGKEVLKEAQKKGRQKMKILREKDDNWSKYYSSQISKGLKKSINKNEGFLNKNHTEETKKKIGIKNSVNQKGENNSQFGTCWITNGIENKKIKKEEIKYYLCNGWNKGRKI